MTPEKYIETLINLIAKKIKSLPMPKGEEMPLSITLTYPEATVTIEM